MNLPQPPTPPGTQQPLQVQDVGARPIEQNRHGAFYYTDPSLVDPIILKVRYRHSCRFEHTVTLNRQAIRYIEFHATSLSGRAIFLRLFYPWVMRTTRREHAMIIPLFSPPISPQRM